MKEQHHSSVITRRHASRTRIPAWTHRTFAAYTTDSNTRRASEQPVVHRPWCLLSSTLHAYTLRYKQITAAGLERLRHEGSGLKIDHWAVMSVRVHAELAKSA